MLRRLGLMAVALLVLFCLASGSAPSPAGAQTPPGKPPTPQNGPLALGGGRAHFFPSKGGIPGASAFPGAPGNNLTYHGGPIMQTSTTYAIFWLPTGVHYESPGFHAPNTDAQNDTNYENTVKSYFQHVGNTSFYNINTQYGSPTSPGPATPLLNTSTFGGSVVDAVGYPSAGDIAHPLLDSDIQAEVTRAISANHWSATLGNQFFVFTGLNIQSCFDASHVDCTFTDYCAYHGAFGPDTNPTIYANMPDTPGNCNTGHSPNNDPNADDVINVTSHEHQEAVTDPLLNAWYDSVGNENGDKCAWVFGPLSGNADVTLNGSSFILQEEWSNAISGCTLSYGGAPPPPPPGGGTMTVSGNVGGVPNGRTSTIQPYVGGVACPSANTTVSFRPFAFTSTINCGSAGQAVTFQVAVGSGTARQASLSTADGNSCFTFAPGGSESGLSVFYYPPFTWDTSCGSIGPPPPSATAPSAPASASASLGGNNTSANVSWTAPSNPGTVTGGSAATITGYTVTASPSVAGSPFSVGASPTNLTVSGLAASTSYTFTVTATNSASLTGPGTTSNSVNTPAGSPATAPTAPASASASLGGNNTSANVTWTAPSNPGTVTGGAAATITGYTVTASPSVSGSPFTVGASPLSLTVSGLAASTSYTFTVAATNSASLTGPGTTSNSVNTPGVSPATAPTAPASAGASLGSNNTSANVTWTAPSNPGTVTGGGAATITGYTVTANPSVAGSPFSVGASPLSLTVNGLAASTQYTFTVAATNSASLTGPGTTSSAVNTPGGSAGSMTIKGNVAGVNFSTPTTIVPLLDNVPCDAATVTLPARTTAYTIQVTCGVAGQAVTFTVNGVAASVVATQNGRVPCIPFTPSATWAGVFLVYNHASNGSCATALAPADGAEIMAAPAGGGHNRALAD